jgi:hypothetical protein
MNPDYISEVYEFEIEPEVYRNNSNLKKKLNTQTTYTREIVPLTHILHNYDKKVLKIPNFKLRYAPIYKIQHVNEASEFVILMKEDLVPIVNFFSNKSSYDYIPYIISTLSYLVTSYDILIEHGIYTVNYSNIGFRNTCCTPVVFDFVEKPVSPSFIPIELYLLNQLTREKIQRLSIQNILDICEKYFKLTERKMTQEHRKQCSDIFSPLVNKSYNEVKQTLIQYKNKWHIYGLGRVYIDLINIVDIPLMPTFLTTILFRCVSIFPCDRPTSIELQNALSFNREL